MSTGIEAALDAMRSVVGSQHVVAEGEELVAQARATIVDPIPPAALVRPGSVDEVRELVRIANRHRVPLWPCSKGNNWGYGTRTPARPGTVTVLLERMDRILELDTELAYAVVEPGVTYRKLAEHLDREAPQLWPDCTDSTPEGSVLGNALERGVGQTPYGDHFGNLCGLEVVTPTAGLVRTGGGPFSSSRTWSLYKWGVGPYLEGLFSQGNFGIVTKAGVWLMPKPESYCSYTFGLDRAEDFPAMIDAVRELALRGVIQTRLHMFNDYTGLTVVTQWDRVREPGETFLGRGGRERAREAYCMQPWAFVGGVYGSPGEVADRKRQLRRSLGRLGRLVFLDSRTARIVPGIRKVLGWMADKPILGAVSDFLLRRVLRRSPEVLEALPHLHSLLEGRPTEYFVRHAYFRSHPEKPSCDVDPARDGCGLMYLAPVAPLAGAELKELLRWLETLHHEAGFDFYAGLLMANPRSVVVLLCLAFDKADPVDAERARAFYRRLSRETLARGYQRYRASVAFADDVFAEAPELRDFVERLQAAVDPQGVIAPGKYGIGAARPGDR